MKGWRLVALCFSGQAGVLCRRIGVNVLPKEGLSMQRRRGERKAEVWKGREQRRLFVQTKNQGGSSFLYGFFQGEGISGAKKDDSARQWKEPLLHYLQIIFMNCIIPAPLLPRCFVFILLASHCNAFMTRLIVAVKYSTEYACPQYQQQSVTRYNALQLGRSHLPFISPVTISSHHNRPYSHHPYPSPDPNSLSITQVAFAITHRLLDRLIG